MFYPPPLTDKQRRWNKFGLYGIIIPGLVLASLPVAWIGTVFVELASSGANVEQGPGVVGEQIDKTLTPIVMFGIMAIFAWFAYRFALNRADTKRLMEEDLDAQEWIPRWVAIEMAVLLVAEVILFKAMAGR
jgi:hypothetical protein